MGITALIMAGGKGSRMSLQQEKPLLAVCGKPMIEHVLCALRNAKKVDNIVVAVSRHTPKTAKMMKEYSVKTLVTPGTDFVSDFQYAVEKLKLNTFMTISADLPLITADIIDEIIECYMRCNKPSLTVAIPAETREDLGLDADYAFEKEGKKLVPAGINIIDGKRISEKDLEEETLVLAKEEVALNVNTPRDLRIAENLFNCTIQRARARLR